MLDKFNKLLNLLEIPRKFVIILIIITLAGSALEILGLSSLYAFLQNINVNNPTDNSFIVKIFGNITQQNIITIFAILFCFIFILKNLIMIFFNFYTYKNLEKIKNNTYQKFFFKILNSNYLDIIKEGHVKHGQVFSRYLDHAFNGYLITCIKLISDSIMGLFIVLFIFYVDFYISLIAFIYLSLISFFIIRKHGKKLKRNSEEISVSEEHTKQHIFELIKNFKEIFAYKIHNIVFQEFLLDMKKYLKSERRYSLIQTNLKSYYEMSIIILIGIVFFYLLSKNLINDSIAILGIIGFSIAKLIPYVNGITSHLNTLKQVSYSIGEVENFYNQSTRNQIENINNKNFNLVKIKSIKIENLSFDYDNLNKIIKNFNENINLNDMVCIIGPSGSGKTTLVDLIMGLLKPNKGNVQFIDDNNNQIKNYSNFAYISQTPCIFKGSLAKNISFKENLNKQEEERLVNIINKIKLFQTTTKDEILSKDIILEGQNLSGGQKQKICIARALYHNSSVLFVDEGTSNLDKESEATIYKILKENRDNKIIFFISHKIQDYSYFDKIIDMKEI